jgi:hypothetical protein
MDLRGGAGVRRGNSERGVTYMEGLTGIEPALSAWEAEVLPLNYSPVPASEERVNASLPARSVMAKVSAACGD